MEFDHPSCYTYGDYEEFLGFLIRKLCMKTLKVQPFPKKSWLDTISICDPVKFPSQSNFYRSIRWGGQFEGNIVIHDKNIQVCYISCISCTGFFKRNATFLNPFFRWPLVTDLDPGSCTFCQMVLRNTCKNPPLRYSSRVSHNPNLFEDMSFWAHDKTAQIPLQLRWSQRVVSDNFSESNLRLLNL